MESPRQRFITPWNWVLQLLRVTQLYPNPQHACRFMLKTMVGVLSNVSERGLPSLECKQYFCILSHISDFLAEVRLSEPTK